jgi:protein involved in polysaccharide export with SLBB domain
MLLNAIAYDVSESADDTLVLSEDLESLLAVANRFYEPTYVSESEEFYTLEPGDTLRITLVSNSAAITTNPNITVGVEYFNVPRTQTAEGTTNPSYVGYPSSMAQFGQG